LNKENLKAEVIVPSDQLSLAIGKQGQNVRLASKLIGWGLDIRTKETASGAALKLEEKAQEKEVITEKAKEKPTLKNLPGVGEKTLVVLRQAGFNSIEALREAKIEDLMKLKGIAKKKAEKLIEEAKKLS
jgi:N utilization substance protein A